VPARPRRVTSPVEIRPFSPPPSGVRIFLPCGDARVSV